MANNLEQQGIADKLNNGITREKAANIIERDGRLVETNADMRRAALYALHRFEAAPWYPKALEMAIAERPEGAFVADETQVHASLDDIYEVLERYIEIVEEKTGAPAIQNELFTARRASWYVARQLTKRGTPMSFAGIDKHIRVNKDLRGTDTGTAMIFTRQQLDEYVANFDKLPKRGRRSRETVNN